MRTALNFATGILVARGLGPVDYGNFMFLLGSFSALRQLLELGTGSAFYTFLSQKPRPAAFIGAFLLWQLLQFLVTALIIGLLLPQQWLDVIWIGQDRDLVLLALLATFLQQQVWFTAAQIGEAARQTHRVQGLSFVLAILHFLLIVILWRAGWLSVSLIFSLFVFEYVLALPAAYRLFYKPQEINCTRLDWHAMVRDYRAYCEPLIVYCWVGFAYAFADAWLLRNYGGASEQGFYAISNQIASVCLFAVTALVPILWKEVAEAHRLQNRVRMEMLFRRTSRFVFWFGAAVSGLLIPWSEEITTIMLGPAFAGSATALAIMLLYHCYGALGQIMNIMFLATNQTRPQVIIGIGFMVISIPISYLVVAPPNLTIPGLGLGAVGMSVKMLALVIINVNISWWWIARANNWRLDWYIQPINIGVMSLCGWFAYCVADSAFLPDHLVVRAVTASLTFVVIAGACLWTMPWIAGTNRNEIAHAIGRFMRLSRILND